MADPDPSHGDTQPVDGAERTRDASVVPEQRGTQLALGSLDNISRAVSISETRPAVDATAEAQTGGTALAAGRDATIIIKEMIVKHRQDTTIRSRVDPHVLARIRAVRQDTCEQALRNKRSALITLVIMSTACVSALAWLLTSPKMIGVLVVGCVLAVIFLALPFRVILPLIAARRCELDACLIVIGYGGGGLKGLDEYMKQITCRGIHPRIADIIEQLGEMRVG